jgi:hypothetical protein
MNILLSWYSNPSTQFALQVVSQHSASTNAPDVIFDIFTAVWLRVEFLGTWRWVFGWVVHAGSLFKVQMTQMVHDATPRPQRPLHLYCRLLLHILVYCYVHVTAQDVIKMLVAVQPLGFISCILLQLIQFKANSVSSLSIVSENFIRVTYIRAFHYVGCSLH